MLFAYQLDKESLCKDIRDEKDIKQAAFEANKNKPVESPSMDDNEEEKVGFSEFKEAKTFEDPAPIKMNDRSLD